MGQRCFSSFGEALSHLAPIAQYLQQEHHQAELQLHLQHDCHPILSPQTDPI